MSNKGLSLVELILAGLISTIIIGGLFSVLFSTQKLSSDTGKNAYVEGSLRAIVNEILRSASAAVGGAGAETGFISPAGMNTFCFAQDMNGSGDLTVADQWACYTYIAPNIYSCTRGYNAAAANRGVTAACAATNQFIGTVSRFPVVNYVAGTNLFSVTVQNRGNLGIGTATLNPEVIVTETVAVPGQTTN